MIVYRCPACPHSDVQHDKQADQHGRACSMGWCSCANTQATVRDVGSATEVVTFPGFDEATGRWA